MLEQPENVVKFSFDFVSTSRLKGVQKFPFFHYIFEKISNFYLSFLTRLILFFSIHMESKHSTKRKTLCQNAFLFVQSL